MMTNSANANAAGVSYRSSGPKKGKKRPPLGSMDRFNAAVAMMSRNRKTADEKGSKTFALALKNKKKAKA